MKLRQPVRVTELFQTFRSRLLDGVAPATPQELLSELSHDASVMRSFDQAPPNTEAGRFFRIVGALNTTTFHPIALLTAPLRSRGSGASERSMRSRAT